MSLYHDIIKGLAKLREHDIKPAEIKMTKSTYDDLVKEVEGFPFSGPAIEAKKYSEIAGVKITIEG